MERDPTLFSRILDSYHSKVRYLLKIQSHPLLQREVILAFRQTYGTSAFVCHFQGCERANNGFASERDLAHHKAKHTARLICCKPGCAYKDIGFSSTRALINHTKRHHSINTVPPLPRTIRRTQKRSFLELSSDLDSSEGRSLVMPKSSSLASLRFNPYQPSRAQLPIDSNPAIPLGDTDMLDSSGLGSRLISRSSPAKREALANNTIISPTVEDYTTNNIIDSSQQSHSQLQLQNNMTQARKLYSFLIILQV